MREFNQLYMNGKLTATTMTLGNVFNPQGFGVCKMEPMFPRPCAPAITKWSGLYDGMTVNGNSNPLIDSSKGACAMGSPGLAQMKQAAAAHQNDINPMEMPEALDENAKDDTPIIKRVYWKNKDGEEINELPDSGDATLCVITENAKAGDTVQFEVQLTDDRKITVSGSVDSEGCVEINNVNIGLE